MREIFANRDARLLLAGQSPVRVRRLGDAHRPRRLDEDADRVERAGRPDVLHLRGGLAPGAARRASRRPGAPPAADDRLGLRARRVRARAAARPRPQRRVADLRGRVRLRRARHGLLPRPRRAAQGHAPRGAARAPPTERSRPRGRACGSSRRSRAPDCTRCSAAARSRCSTPRRSRPPSSSSRACACRRRSPRRPSITSCAR